ncbi:hypothetical protein T484DRAFT_3639626 [Baffinella frigidus]|nr:hypothetical protein T484DRAFT_3639626 [Cryptophyta sp. CCMP2293]
MGMRCDLMDIQCDLMGIQCDLMGIQCDLMGMQCDLMDIQFDLMGIQCDLMGIRNITLELCDLTGVECDLMDIQCDLMCFPCDLMGIQCDLTGVECDLKVVVEPYELLKGKACPSKESAEQWLLPNTPHQKLKLPKPPNHTVDYEPFRKSQLALMQLTLEIFWCDLVTYPPGLESRPNEPLEAHRVDGVGAGSSTAVSHHTEGYEGGFGH